MTNESTEHETNAAVGGRVDPVVMRCRTIEVYHKPDGWPAIQMRDITALCDEIERLSIEVNVQAHWGPKWESECKRRAEIEAVADKYKQYMIDMGKMYFFLREAHCINVPEQDEDEDGLLEQYKDFADQTCDAIRDIATNA